MTGYLAEIVYWEEEAEHAMNDWHKAQTDAEATEAFADYCVARDSLDILWDEWERM